MQFPDNIIDQLSPQVIKIIAITAVGLLVSIGFYSASQIRAFFAGMDEKLDTIKDNHLEHIQANTNRTADLLEKLVDSQAEMNGFLKGKLDN
jgi:hypothetical protein